MFSPFLQIVFMWGFFFICMNVFNRGVISIRNSDAFFSLLIKISILDSFRNGSMKNKKKGKECHKHLLFELIKWFKLFEFIFFIEKIPQYYLIIKFKIPQYYLIIRFKGRLMFKQSNSSPLTGDWQDVELFCNPNKNIFVWCRTIYFGSLHIICTFKQCFYWINDSRLLIS